MRPLADRDRLLRFMRDLGRETRTPARVYLTGGSSAVLMEWRQSTIDVDLEIRPESDEILRALPRLKEELGINIELASPAHFIPEVPGWESRSPFIQREGSIDFHHYDFYAQALSKIERSHTRDRLDVEEMYRRNLIQLGKMMELFEAIEGQLYKYPAIDLPTFRLAVERAVRLLAGNPDAE